MVRRHDDKVVAAVVRHYDNVLAAVVRHVDNGGQARLHRSLEWDASQQRLTVQSSTPTYPQLHAFRICACQSESSPMTQQLWMARWGSSSFTMPCTAKTGHKQS